MQKSHKSKIKVLRSKTLKNTWRVKNGENSVHSLHTIASRVGSFPPSLARYFILKYSKEGDAVLDPYSGKGTVPLEAILNKRFGIGNDVAPEAYVLNHAKLHNVTHEDLIKFVSRIKLRNGKMDDVTKEVRIFFSKKTLAQLVPIREFLLGRHDKVAHYAKAILVGILHGKNSMSLSLPCSHSFSMAPNYVKKYAGKHNLVKPDRDVIGCMLEKSRMVQRDKIPTIEGKVLMKNAENLEGVSSNSVDLIVTSPPYLNAQTYAWDNWLRLWFLGYDYRSVRKNMTQTASLQVYKEHIRKSLTEMLRVIIPGHYAFIVVGDVKVKNSSKPRLIRLAYEIASVVQEIRLNGCKFSIKGIIDDPLVLHRRYNSSYLKGHDGVKRDRILCLYKKQI